MRREGTITAPDGARIWYGLTGQGDKMPLALCDGIACDGFIWPHLMDYFSDERPILRWHYRGHGLSEASEDPAHLTLETLTHDLRQILDQLELDQAFVAGHSMGVQVALEFYRQYPQRVAGLGLLCGSYGRPLSTFRGSDQGEKMLPWIRSMVERAPRLVGGVWKYLVPTGLSFRLAQQTEIHPQRAARADFFPYLEHVSRMDVRVFLAMLDHAARHTAEDVLADVQVPTLVVAGENDGFTPASLSHEMARRIAGSELLMLPGGTHTAPIEFPELVNQRLQRFLERHGM